MELMATGASRHDYSRFGFEVTRNSARQADLIIIAGSISYKMAPVLKRLYNQMAEPKYVIAMGGCAISGGPFVNSYNVVKGVDKIIPVDVYIPGCPPRPESLFYGLLQLQRKVKVEGFFHHHHPVREYNPDTLIDGKTGEIIDTKTTPQK
jgi:NADH-quinone oxidoreductase subunit B